MISFTKWLKENRALLYFFGAFNFYLEEGKVRFEINDCAARRENLKISSKLLRLARIVCSNNR
ncbi:MAG: YfiR family protein [Nitrospinae bacterium]|nr:YfiR family protein [Nitrospinota bacterium]